MDGLRTLTVWSVLKAMGCLAVGSLGGILLTLWTISRLEFATEYVTEAWLQPGSTLELPVTAQAVVKGETIELEVATTPKEVVTGLRFRAALPDNRGMLFEFSEPEEPITWTKHLQFPIDVIYLLGGEVQAVAANLPPCDREVCLIYGVSVAVDQVLELPGGRAEELGIAPGDQIRIEAVSAYVPD